MIRRINSSTGTAASHAEGYDDRLQAAYVEDLKHVRRPPPGVSPQKLTCMACKEPVISFGGETGKKALCPFCYTVLLDAEGNGIIAAFMGELKRHYRHYRRTLAKDPKNVLERIMP